LINNLDTAVAAGIKINTRIPLKREPAGTALFFLTPDMNFRRFIFRICEDSRFEKFILVLIVISSILLSQENPLNDPNSNLMRVLNYIDIGITSTFVLEALLKIIAYGWIFNGAGSYLRNVWNIGDFVIVLFAMLSILS
jgi:hypothetical protein